jgi:hypothetical protein
MTRGNPKCEVSNRIELPLKSSDGSALDAVVSWQTTAEVGSELERDVPVLTIDDNPVLQRPHPRSQQDRRLLAVEGDQSSVVGVGFCDGAEE